jgi:hypothetical protein
VIEDIDIERGKGESDMVLLIAERPIISSPKDRSETLRIKAGILNDVSTEDRGDRLPEGRASLYTVKEGLAVTKTRRLTDPMANAVQQALDVSVIFTPSDRATGV